MTRLSHATGRHQPPGDRKRLLTARTTGPEPAARARYTQACPQAPPRGAEVANVVSLLIVTTTALTSAHHACDVHPTDCAGLAGLRSNTGNAAHRGGVPGVLPPHGRPSVGEHPRRPDAPRRAEAAAASAGSARSAGSRLVGTARNPRTAGPARDRRRPPTGAAGTAGPALEPQAASGTGRAGGSG